MWITPHRWSAAAVAALLSGAAPAAAELSAETLETLATLDRLTAPGDPELFHSGARWIVGQQAVEADGVPPVEHVVEVHEYTGEGTWQAEYHLYGAPVAGVPRRLAPPISVAAYRDAGYLLTVDVAGDGREALVVVGDTSGDSVSTVDAWLWVDGGFAPAMLGGDPGVEYAALELGFVGEALVALSPPLRDAAADVAVLAPIDGIYQRWPVPPGPWLVRLMTRAATVDPPRRPDHLWAALGAVVRDVGLSPPAEVQRALEAQHAGLATAWTHAALIGAMGWSGNTAARAHLRGVVEAPSSVAVRAAAVEALVRVGDEGDRDAVLALLAEGDRAVVGAALEGFEAVGDGRALKAVEAALVDGATPAARRRGLVEALKGRAAAIPTLARALSAAVADEGRAGEVAALVDALGWLAVVARHAPGWRSAGAATRAAAAHADRGVRAGVIPALVAADPRAADTLRLRAAVEAEPGVLLAVLDALAEVAPELVAIRQAAVERLLASGAPRETLHRLVAGHGAPASRAAAIRWASDAAAIGVHGGSFETRPLPAGPVRAAAVAALTARLAPGEPDRVRQAAAEALGALDAAQDAAARTALVATLRGDGPVWVRSAAAEALSAPDRVAAEALWAALRAEGSSYVRGAIVEALGGHGQTAALVERLTDAELGWHAARALAQSEAGRRALGAWVVARSRAGACETVDGVLSALARVAARETEEAFAAAAAGCPAQARVGAVVADWPREAASERRWLGGYVDPADRESLRAWWR